MFLHETKISVNKVEIAEYEAVNKQAVEARMHPNFLMSLGYLTRMFDSDNELVCTIFCYTVQNPLPCQQDQSNDAPKQINSAFAHASEHLETMLSALLATNLNA